MQPDVAPCMTGAFNFKKMKLSTSACCMHAATSVNLQEWVCPLDGWTPWTSHTFAPPTQAPWPQELNLSCETMFLFHYSKYFKMLLQLWCFSFKLLLQASLSWGLSWPANHQHSAKTTRKVCGKYMCIYIYMCVYMCVCMYSLVRVTIRIIHRGESDQFQEFQTFETTRKV